MTLDARTLSAADYHLEVAKLIDAPALAADRARDAADLAAARARYFDTAAAADAVVRDAARVEHGALVKRLIKAELDLLDARTASDAAAAGPSLLDRTRAEARLTAAARVRDDLTLAAEAAHTAAYSKETN